MAKKDAMVDLVGKEVFVQCTDGNRVTADTKYYGTLQELGEHGVRLMYTSHGSTFHSFIPYANMIELGYKVTSKEKEKEKSGEKEETEE